MVIIRGQPLWVKGKRQTMKLDFDEFAATYAKYRRPSPSVVRHIVDSIALSSVPTILDVGCGTGNYLSLLSQEFGGEGFGFDISRAMLSQASLKHPKLHLVRADAEAGIPYGDNSVDFTFMIDVIHYIQDLKFLFSELLRVLRLGALLLVVTVCEEDIRNQTMAQYFPETVDVELCRHHSISNIVSNMEAAGLKEVHITHTEHIFRPSVEDLNGFRSKIFYALRLISHQSFQRGIAKLEEDVNKERGIGNEFHTFIWGLAPHRTLILR